MSLSKQIETCEKKIKKCKKDIESIVGSGYTSIETKSLIPKIHQCMRLMALENDDIQRKCMFGVDAFPKDTVYVDMKDRKGNPSKDKDGNVKQKVIHGHYRLADVDLKEKKSTRKKVPTRPRRKAVIYDAEDDEDPIDIQDPEPESEPDSGDSGSKPEQKYVAKKYTLDMGKEGMLAITGTLRMLIWEIDSVTRDVDSLPISSEKIKEFLDDKIQSSGKFNIYQFLVHVMDATSLATRSEMFKLDDLSYNAIKDYCGNNQIALHASNLFTHFVKVVAIQCSNMAWDNKSLRRINSKVFTVFRNLELGFEKHKTISAGALYSLMKFVDLNNKRDQYTRERAKLVKEQNGKPGRGKKADKTSRQPKKGKSERTSGKKGGLLRKRRESGEDSDPEPYDEMSD